MRNLFFTDRFFLGLIIMICLFTAGAIHPIMAGVATVAVLVFCLAFLLDLALLFWPDKPLTGDRIIPNPLSLDDPQEIQIEIKNNSRKYLTINIIDELPEQFQKRDFGLKASLLPGQLYTETYTIRPKQRGVFEWGRLLVFAQTVIGLAERRYTVAEADYGNVYPSIIQMKRTAWLGLRNSQWDVGEKRLKRMGQSYEFDRIKNYVQGDDVRLINWRATSRRQEMMVNQFVDERSQHIVCVIDKSRSMELPFNGLTLLDYSINAALALSNVAMLRGDKAGLLMFGQAVGSFVPPDNSTRQRRLILDALFDEKPNTGESNYELLHRFSSRILRTRGLLVLFTNFESQSSLERVLPLLRLIRRSHLLLIVSFVNTEVEEATTVAATDLRGVYHHISASQFLQEKQLIQQQLQRSGIGCLLVKPENLTMDVINKYVEMKLKNQI
jgi:uncharacterized protein (DUF58 family)